MHFILFMLFFGTLQAHTATPKKEYQCYRYNRISGDAEKCGGLTYRTVGNADYISIKQLCYSFQCQVYYQWPLHRVIVKNNTEQLSALLSSLTKIALIDGKVHDFTDPVLSNPGDGFSISLDLAVEIISKLKLGRIEIKEEAETKKNTQQANEPKTLKVIIIDPGHGGNDFGTSYGSLYEKDLSLIYSMKLKQEIEEKVPEIKVFLTREEDRFVSLSDRAHFANEKKADLFFSLHVNHAANSASEGVETFILNPEATDDDAKKLALLENESWIKTAQLNKDKKSQPIQKMLVDLEQTKYIQDSALFASHVQQEIDQMDKTLKIKNRGVKQAMFYVLSQVAMPSALIEMGFLSNLGDRGRLMNIHFRNDFINRLVFAIKKYKTRKE